MSGLKGKQKRRCDQFSVLQINAGLFLSLEFVSVYLSASGLMETDDHYICFFSCLSAIFGSSDG